MDDWEGTLQRDCKATLIPAGDEVILPVGTPVQISQALGGSLTVRSASGLYRIGKEDADALGAEIAESLAKGPDTAGDESEPFREEMIWDALRTCFDPEIPINIVDLGLIYDLRVDDPDPGQDRYKVGIKMTLTAHGCGMGPTIAADAKSKVEAIPCVDEAEVDIVWDPQWTPHMISPEGRKVLGLD